VTKGVLKSVRKANLRLRIKTLDEPRYCGVYRLGRTRSVNRFRQRMAHVSSTLPECAGGDGAESAISRRESANAIEPRARR
jgi:hypothetical protein